MKKRLQIAKNAASACQFNLLSNHNNNKHGESIRFAAARQKWLLKMCVEKKSFLFKKNKQKRASKY